MNENEKKSYGVIRGIGILVEGKYVSLADYAKNTSHGDVNNFLMVSTTGSFSIDHGCRIMSAISEVIAENNKEEQCKGGLAQKAAKDIGVLVDAGYVCLTDYVRNASLTGDRVEFPEDPHIINTNGFLLFSLAEGFRTIYAQKMETTISRVVAEINEEKQQELNMDIYGNSYKQGKWIYTCYVFSAVSLFLSVIALFK